MIMSLDLTTTDSDIAVIKSIGLYELWCSRPTRQKRGIYMFLKFINCMLDSEE